MDQTWTDKIVIVTGGGGGMGQAAAKRFADAGAKTFVFGRTLESLQETAALSKNILPIVCDVADTASKWAVHGLLFTARMQLNAHGVILSEYAPGEALTPLVKLRPVQPTEEHKAKMITTTDCGDTLFFIASQPHSMSVIQLPGYQPFGGMPPPITAPWLSGLEIKAK
jgi:NADP-dependent 3-hydroxy acid dehydrogenase YdfG